MEEILKNLSSPSWWFSAVIISIIASVFAGFLRDWIPSWFSRYNQSVKKRNYNRKKLLAKNVQILISHQQFHNSSAMMLQREITFIFFMFFFIMGIGPLHSFFMSNPEYDLLHNSTPHFSSNATGLLTMIALVSLLPRIFFLQRKLLIMSFVHRRLRRFAIANLEEKKGIKR